VVSAGGADPADVVIFAGGADSTGTFIFAGISVAAVSSIPFAPSSPIKDPAKGKAIATPSSHVTALSDKELADQQAAIFEAERQRLLEQELKQSLDAEQVYLDSLGHISVRMVDLMNQWRKAIADMKAKAKRDKPMAPAQQKEYMRAFVENQSTFIYTTGWTWKDVRGLTDDQLQNKLKSSYSTEQSAELRDTTSVFVGVTIAAGDPISAVPSVSTASSIPAETPIAAGVSTTAGVSESASEIIPTEFGLGEIHVITRADGTVKRFSTLRELMHWVGRADLMVLYGMVLDKYKLERATGIGLGLWSDLRTLITAREERDASIIWDDQD
nr:aminoacyl-tRNA synthetase, class 1a, anticodon-binding [Tanacetum cinerariifolium]